MKTPETANQPSNQPLRQTFKMEDFMKTQTTSKFANKFWLILVVAFTLLLGACSQQPMPGEVEGLEPQFGTSSSDSAHDAAGNSTGVYVVGGSSGSLAGPNIGDDDAYVRKYDFSGNVIWQGQFGTSQADGATNITIHTDKIYVLGNTYGALNGSFGGKDVFLRQYNDSGSIVWTRQFGTAADDVAADVATDSAGNAIVVSKDGSSLGFKIRKVTPAGVVSTLATWSPLPAIVNYHPRAVVTDSSNNVYVLADSFNNSSTSHIFKFNSSGLYLGGTSTKGSNEKAHDLTVVDNHIFALVHENGQNVIKKFPTTFTPSTLPVATVVPDPSLGLIAIKVSGGSLYLAGNASAAKYSTNLVKQWEKKFIIAFKTNGLGLAVSSPSNAVYPVGVIRLGINIPSDAYLAKVDMATGVIAWTK